MIMKIKIKRIDKSLPLPRQKEGAACFDFVCRETTTIKPSEIKLVPSNTVIKVPQGYALLIFARSSTPLRKGLVLANGVGVTDPFFCGDKDEIILEFLNVTDEDVTIERGESLAQGMVVKHETVEWEEVSEMKEEGKGGYSVSMN